MGDEILDLIDADFEDPVASDDDDQQRVNAAKRGCNKHFKDEFLFQGWFVHRCHEADREVTTENVDDVQFSQRWCVKQDRKDNKLLTEGDIDIFRPAYEAIHIACEKTLGYHKDEIA